MHITMNTANEYNGVKKSPRSDNSEDSDIEDDLFDSSLLADSPTPSEECNSNVKSRDFKPVIVTKLSAETSSSSSLAETSSSSAGMFSGMCNTFDPLQFDPLRLLMNRSLNAAAVLNPILGQSAAMLNLQQQLSKHMSSTLSHASTKQSLGSSSSATQIQEDRDEATSTCHLQKDRKRTADRDRTLVAPKRSKLLIDEILNLRTNNEEDSVKAEEHLIDGSCHMENRSPSSCKEQSLQQNLATKDEENELINDNCVKSKVLMTGSKSSCDNSNSSRR
ncbi:unnamed protein product [Thelazia callipaeda]|uniref:Prospero domain-containing protein n=1 Tax=Thelazia callipaeda TaxID=103827 RepID=A0A0N5CR91_THECL|nr:unnamed protein product [Thelazia callipaeda]